MESASARARANFCEATVPGSFERFGSNTKVRGTEATPTARHHLICYPKKLDMSRSQHKFAA
jgi:hypothetical protein